MIYSMALRFTKGQGTGNDFVLYLDESGDLALTPQAIARICNRHFGIGADGVIRVIKSEHLAAGKEILTAEPEAIWFMDYYNADGTTAEMCGNGVRVFARYLVENNLVNLVDGQTLSVGTRSGVKDLQQNMAGFAVDLGRWKLGAENVLVESASEKVSRPSLGIDLGNPHLVVALSSLNELEKLNLSEAPQLAPAQKAGANIEFVVPHDPMVKNGAGNINMRVYERGVGETLSCGTGVVAAALATRHWAGAGAPNQWQVTVPGGTLGVRMFATEDGEHVGLSGAAELSFEGTWQLLDGELVLS